MKKLKETNILNKTFEIKFEFPNLILTPNLNGEGFTLSVNNLHGLLDAETICSYLELKGLSQEKEKTFAQKIIDLNKVTQYFNYLRIVYAIAKLVDNLHHCHIMHSESFYRSIEELNRQVLTQNNVFPLDWFKKLNEGIRLSNLFYDELELFILREYVEHGGILSEIQYYFGDNNNRFKSGYFKHITKFYSDLLSESYNCLVSFIDEIRSRING